MNFVENNREAVDVAFLTPTRSSPFRKSEEESSLAFKMKKYLRTWEVQAPGREDVVQGDRQGGRQGQSLRSSEPIWWLIDRVLGTTKKNIDKTTIDI